MGEFAEACAEKYNFSRHDQDTYAAESYRRASEATKSGKFRSEIEPIEMPSARRPGQPPTLVHEDDEIVARTVTIDSLAKLRPAFQANTGTVTAGNASTISDGAAALVLVARSTAIAWGLKILAVVRGFDDAAQEPKCFTTSPALAISKALGRSGIGLDAIDFFEINEAFSVVALANLRLLQVPPDHVNVYGGAVAIGHPLGCSGARILVTLCSVLSQEGGRYGCAAVCNGGGGATAIVIECS